MAWQDVDRIERDGNVWILRFNAKYGDFSVKTVNGGIGMSVEDNLITICINGIGYLDIAKCRDYANALHRAVETAEKFQRTIDNYVNNGWLTVEED
ncbi:hypothetical protein [uncultured Bifidobacterium sp.]|uniref:hypothetical protein n=1 Tax=uncultured Bifidobacterium sp. TaxID=165187 RepID=UPI0025897A78|nr:hypothetical protein [uncultured Bifidobacterium sp.]